MKTVVSTNFAKSYLGVLTSLIAEPDYVCDSRLGYMNEIINYSFKCPLAIDWEIFHKRFTHWNYEYAKVFFEWMMSGSTDMEELAVINPSVRRFMPGSEIPANFSTAYGPRLAEQWEANVLEFRKENSRRVVFHILQPGDDFLRAIDTKLEYPCCSNIILFKRYEASKLRVDTVATFRSSNCYITMLYDVHNISKFVQAFVESNNEFGELELGTLSFQIASAHLYHSNLEHAKQLIGC